MTGMQTQRVKTEGDAKGQGEVEDANDGYKRKAITTRRLVTNKGGIKLSLWSVTRRYRAAAKKRAGNCIVSAT